MFIKQFLALSLSVSICAGAVAITDTASAANGKATAKTVTAGKFTFSYTIEGKNLSATVSYPAIGWIAVGFNPKTVMKGANFIIGSVDSGKAVVSDEFGDGMFSHAPDTVLGGKNDIISGDCKQANGVTTLSFTIPLDSGDDKDVKLAAGQKVKLIFAFGASKDTRKKHKDTAKALITL